MSLNEKFKSFAKEQNEKLKLDEKKTLVEEFITKHHQKVSIAVEMAEAFKSFASNKSPFSFVKGAFKAVDIVAKANSYYSYRLFSRANGWQRIQNMSIVRILAPALDIYQYRTMGFEYDRTSCKILDTPVGEIVFITTNDAGGHGDQYNGSLYFKFKHTTEEAVIDMLVAERVKQLDSNVLTLVKQDTSAGSTALFLIAEPIDPKPSKNLNSILEYLKRCFGMNISRSIMFQGPPGSGKSSLAQGLVSDLKLKTLIYKSDNYDATTLFFIIKHFKIECVVLDDLDQIPNSNRMLNMLERLNKEVKLVIGLVNSLKEMHSATHRPRRFDLHITIDAMDEEAVRIILGDLTNNYFDRVKKWPIAFLNELVIRSKTYPIEQLETHYKELNDRVERQLADLGKISKKIKKDDDQFEDFDETDFPN